MGIKESPIAVLGPGSWGTALSLVLGRNGNPVRLWGNIPEQIAAIQATGENSAFLPGIPFPETITAFESLSDALDGVSDILLAVPSHAFRSVLEAIAALQKDNLRILWATKGLEAGTGRFLHDLVFEILPDAPQALLSGPSFAKEVANAVPTWINLVCSDAQFVADCEARFTNSVFHFRVIEDMIGVSLCSVVKNVLAIGVGMIDGLSFGANTRAAFLTCGLCEMASLVEALGGKRDTVMTLAGLGDVVLTCTDNQSRNRRLGVALGAGKTVEQAFEEIGQEVEGFHNVKQVYALAVEAGVTLPIVFALHRILCEGDSVDSLIGAL